MVTAACTSKNSTGTTTGTATPANSSASGKFPADGLTQLQASEVIEKLEGKIPPSQGDTTRGITGHTITVEGVADVTNAGTVDSPGYCIGAKAAFAAADRAGGVNGYKINYVGCLDSQSSATQGQLDLERAVDVDKAFAVVPMDAETVNGTFLNQNHVPYFGLGVGPAYCPGWSSLAYGVSPVDGIGCTLAPASPAETVLTDGALAGTLKAVNMKPKDSKWAFVGSNLSFLKIIQDDYATMVKNDLGGQVSYSESPGPAPGAPPLADWAPVAQQVVSSGANIVNMLLSDKPDLLGLISALKSAGFTGTIFSSTPVPINTSNPTEASVMNGVLNESQWFSNEIFSTPFAQQVVANLKAIGEGNASLDDSTLWYSYMSAEFFLDALKAVKGPLTAESLMNMVNAGFTFPAFPGGGYEAIRYPGGRLAQDNYIGLWKLDGTQRVPALVPGDFGQNYFIPAA
jgi:branched-chain amino acid transport system substrate-binding protein